MISSFVIWARLVTRIQHRASPAQHTATHHSSLYKYNLYKTRLPPVLSMHLVASVPQSGDSTLQQHPAPAQDIKVCLHRNITTQTSHQLILPHTNYQMPDTFFFNSIAIQDFSGKQPKILSVKYQGFLRGENERFQVSKFPCLTLTMTMGEKY